MFLKWNSNDHVLTREESKVPDIKGYRANYGTVSLVLPYKHTAGPRSAIGRAPDS